MLSNHSGLRYLFDQPNLNVKQVIWLDTISELEFEIKYIRGKENIVADALIDRILVNHISVMSSYGTD